MAEVLSIAMQTRFFEDFSAGTRLKSGTYSVTADEIIAFAREFDPQPFHLSAEAAESSLFRGLAASGWHTAALSMRAFIDTMQVKKEGIIGLGVDELRWPAAVRAGDTLEVEIEILEARFSRSKPDYGLIRIRNTTRNQRGEVVQVFTANAMLPRREG